MFHDKIWIFDTTLRDGEQAPGAAMNTDEKIKIAHALALLNVDIIEAGFPVSSQTQFEACQAIADSIQGPVIAGLCRAVEKDIQTCFNAIKSSSKPRIHTFLATSPIHMQYKLKMKPEAVLKHAVNAVQFAKSLTEDVEFSAEDASRSELSFLAEIVSAVIAAGATVVNIPDTVGYTTPREYYERIAYLKQNVKNIESAILSVHCHNDLGLAVSNSLSACQAGARQIECTINGIGERAGNAALEEIVMAIKTRKDYYPFQTSIDTTKIYSTSRLVSQIIGYPIQPNKAIIGKNAFAHESGIHQDGVLKHKETYEIMSPETIGRSTGELVLGRHSGKAGFKAKIKELNFTLDENLTEQLYARFIEIADKRKEISDEDILAILGEAGLENQGYQLDYLSVVTGEKIIPTATLKISFQKNTYKESAIGDGPIDAVYNAINKIISVKDIKLDDFSIQSVSSGKDAIGQTSLRIICGSIFASGVAMDTDIIVASAKAYLNAVNKVLLKQGSKDNDQFIEKGI